MKDLSSLSIEDLLARTEEVGASDATRESDARWDCVYEAQSRGDQRVFEAARTWCGSDDSLMRGLGADVLGQLGPPEKRPFASESVPILTALLTDSSPEVASCALVALGHLRMGELADIGACATHASEDVRQSVAFCLSGRDEPGARDVLILLSDDPELDVRNWATFGLAALEKCSDDAVRDALTARLEDHDPEVRGEALLGLARRGDDHVVPAICSELEEDEVTNLAIQAASVLPDPSFLEPLEDLLEDHPDDEDVAFAIERCRAG